jgi:ribose transport system ATP-binding protein
VVGVAGLLGPGREELPYVLAGAASEGVTGEFTIAGETEQTLSIARARDLGVAFVPADRANESIFGDFTTGENVSLANLPALAPRGVLRLPTERQFSRTWLRSVRASEDAAPRKITTLSGGNQQKAVLARRLSVTPRVLVLAEPTVGVDIGARNAIYEELRQAFQLMADKAVIDLGGKGEVGTVLLTGYPSVAPMSPLSPPRSKGCARHARRHQSPSNPPPWARTRRP